MQDNTDRTYSLAVEDFSKNLRVGKPDTPKREPNSRSASASTFAMITSLSPANASPTCS